MNFKMLYKRTIVTINMVSTAPGFDLTVVSALSVNPGRTVPNMSNAVILGKPFFLVSLATLVLILISYECFILILTNY